MEVSWKECWLIPSINTLIDPWSTLNWYSINTPSTARLTLAWHSISISGLRQTVKSRLILDWCIQVCQYSANYCSTVDLMSIKTLSVNWVVDRRSIKVSIASWPRIPFLITFDLIVLDIAKTPCHHSLLFSLPNW